jgi:hypothetical protein
MGGFVSAKRLARDVPLGQIRQSLPATHCPLPEFTDGFIASPGHGGELRSRHGF